MTLFFFITLCFSATMLVLLLGVKRYEMNTGHVIFMRARPKAARIVHIVVLFIQHVLPFIARRSAAQAFRLARAGVSNMLARLTLYIETSLRRLLLAIQQGMQPKRGGGVTSAFLREVAEHKKKLLNDPEERKAFFDEENKKV